MITEKANHITTSISEWCGVKLLMGPVFQKSGLGHYNVEPIYTFYLSTIG
jgi:hypothetical protein